MPVEYYVPVACVLATVLYIVVFNLRQARQKIVEKESRVLDYKDVIDGYVSRALIASNERAAYQAAKAVADALGYTLMVKVHLNQLLRVTDIIKNKYRRETLEDNINKGHADFVLCRTKTGLDPAVILLIEPESKTDSPEERDFVLIKFALLQCGYTVLSYKEDAFDPERIKADLKEAAKAKK